MRHRGGGWFSGSAPVRALAVLALAAGLCLAPESGDRMRAAAAGQVDLNLVLAIDCSYSVDNREFALQVNGMAEAFRDPEIVQAIAAGPRGSIAVSVVQWSDAAHQQVALPWSIIASPSDAEAVAARLAALPRLLEDGGTSITAMMRFGVRVLRDSPVIAARQVIDIAADGRNNNGGSPRAARNDAAEMGIAINGLAILNEVPTLDRYFEQRIIVGPGSFVIVANDYASYAKAIKRKLLREIIGPAVS